MLYKWWEKFRHRISSSIKGNIKGIDRVCDCVIGARVCQRGEEEGCQKETTKSVEEEYQRIDRRYSWEGGA